MELDFMDFIFPSYSVPFIRSCSINILIKGHTNLGAFNIDTTGIQARLIGLFFIFFSSPFLIAWIACIIFKFYSECFQYGIVLFIFLIIVCFYFQ